MTVFYYKFISDYGSANGLRLTKIRPRQTFTATFLWTTCMFSKSEACDFSK